MTQTLYLFDGHALVYRAFYAIEGLTTPDGRPTGAIYGFIRMIRDTLRKHGVKCAAVAFDAKGPTFRHEAFAEYKATRKETPAELIEQVPEIQRILQAQGIPIFVEEGYEADDVLGTLTRQAREAGMEVVLVSGDKDLAQLLGPGVSMYDPKSDRWTTAEDFRQKRGVDPDRLPDVMGLWGDSSDNIPGVPGIGEKGAFKLINEYGTLDDLLERADAIKGKRGERLREHAQTARMSRELARIDCEAPVDLSPEACRVDPPDTDRLREIYRELGFKSLLRELEEGSDNPGSGHAATASADPRQEDTPNGDYTLVNTPEAFGRFLQELRAQTHIAFDTETVSMDPAHPDWSRDPMRADLVGLSISWRAGAGHYLPFRGPSDEAVLQREHLEALGEIFADPNVTKTAHNVKFDVLVLRNAGIEVDGVSFDSMLAAHLVGEMPGRLGLDALAERILGVKTIPIGTLFAGDGETDESPPEIQRRLEALRTEIFALAGREFNLQSHAQLATVLYKEKGYQRPAAATSKHGTDRDSLALLAAEAGEAATLPRLLVQYFTLGSLGPEKCMDAVPVTQMCDYAAEDADIALRLQEHFQARLEAEGLVETFGRTEIPLAGVLARMQQTGICLDTDLLPALGRDLQEQIHHIEEEIFHRVERRFNLLSPKQLGEVLFDELGFPVQRRTKTSRSTDEDTLSKLALLDHDHAAVPQLLLKHREYTKLKNTYIDALPTMVNPRTGRAHTSFHQAGTATGRLSSSDPNLQNIPVRTATGRGIRAAFIPAPGWTMVAADYSQIELRMLAHLAGDEALQQAFREDRDIHRAVAAILNDIPEEDVTDEERSRAKAVNFGIVYGQTAYGLRNTTGMELRDAQAFIDDYFSNFRGVESFLVKTVEVAREAGGVRTILRHFRPLPELKSNNKTRRQAAERMAVNTLVQGSAADLIKRAMVQLSERLREQGLQSNMLLQIHDELVLECPPDELDTVTRLVREEMESAMALSVPLKVDIGRGPNWLEAK
jgi:DNA polymerase-1